MKVLPPFVRINSNSKLNQASGYTLVELLISITISAVLLTYGFSAYRKSQDRQTIQAAGETIIKTLRETQKKAQIGEKDCIGPLLGYYARMLPDVRPSIILITPQCEAQSGTTTTIEIPNITFNQSTTILFKTLNSGLSITDPIGTTSTNITFTSITGITHSVQIIEPGTIQYTGQL